MKLTIINNEPIYISKDRAESVIKAISSGQELIEIDGNYYRPSAIMAITNEDEPKLTPAYMWGMNQPKTTLNEIDTPKGDGKGYERYQAIKQKILAKKNI